ncbi:hypothetical protein GNP61_09990 [Aliivibrio fischeri]|uniref:hypothetical protein n=1 Tax=Aliivibrio fischeri TaxID=668 RepID=UPI0012DA8803|nr:hypothetical protein [Aliivibrio fischeri]MUK41885.1 hypothetical protein [Aliivibrio fischeri]
MTAKKSENLVDFGLCLYAKDYYQAAQTLKDNGVENTPYHIMLALSVECFLKSIRTTTEWSGSIGTKVHHVKNTHDLDKIFHKLEVNHPNDAKWLKDEYFRQYSRSLKDDIELNKNVFTYQRYPYTSKGDIPKVPLSSTPEEMLYGIKYSNDIAVYVTMLEYVAKFLFDVIGSYFNRN